MNKAARTYMLQFGTAMTAYAILLILAIFVVNANPTAWWRVVVIVIPVLPMLFGLFAVIRFINQQDELQRRIQLEALAFGFGCTVILTFTYGFLELVGLPHISWLWVLPVMMTLWTIGLAIASRRYR